MPSSYLPLALSLLATAQAASPKLQTCPLLGQQYPPPTQLSTNSQWQALAKGLDTQIAALLPTAGYNSTSFSVGIFSPSDPDLIYQYNHASPFLAKQQGNASTAGARNITADSVFRIGSVSKLFTMYLWLLSDGDVKFNTPLADYIPQLLNVTDDWNALTPEWSEITIGDLAGQMGGIARDFGLTDFAPPANAAFPIPPIVRASFPALPADEIPTCGYLEANGSLDVCSEDVYLQGVATMTPVFPAAYTPAYSNDAFALLGIALANIVGKPLETIFNDSLVAPLGLQSTLYSPPSSITSLDVVPGNSLESGWSTEFGVFGAAGGFFTSTNDFATIGRAILNFTQLPASTTRRWLKPTSFLEEFDQGVGRPWEIFRRKVAGQSVSLYTKSGDWGYYHSFFAVIPTYNIGITILTAEDAPGAYGGYVRDTLPDGVLDALLPILNEIALSQAGANFAGKYTSQQTNSSLHLTSDSTGLQVTQWIYNGTIIQSEEAGALLGTSLSFRLLPNQLYAGDSSKVGFTSFYQHPAPTPTNETWYLSCPGWFDVDEAVYGNIPLGNMVFSVDTEGKATEVELRALRTTLTKTG